MEKSKQTKKKTNYQKNIWQKDFVKRNWNFWSKNGSHLNCESRARADGTVNAVLVKFCWFCCCKFGCDDIRCHLCVVVVSLKTQLLSLQCESWYIQQLLISNYSRKRNSLLNGFNCSPNELRRGKTILDLLITTKVFFLSEAVSNWY